MVTAKKKCVAMLLAGGQGSRLGVLTRFRAKPAVPYGGKYRIIDFPLSNCTNSGIDTVGVLTQYQPLELNAYIGTGQPWDLDGINGGAFVLPPYVRGSEKGEWYSGTANAIFQNIYFIEKYDPDYLLVLSGDHIYKMDYAQMLRFHQKNNADATIAVLRVPLEEASRFGIMNAGEDFRIYDFEEKPQNPKSDMASMGVYMFSWRKLKEYLVRDDADKDSQNDFGKNIIPAMLSAGERMFAYPFSGYWKDVGTIESLWEANMELLADRPAVVLRDPSWRIYSRNPNQPPHYVGYDAVIDRSLVSEGCHIYGRLERSVLFPGVVIHEGAVVRDSIIMQDTVIGSGCVIDRAIIDENVTVGSDCRIGGTDGIAVVGSEAVLNDGSFVGDGGVVDPRAVITRQEVRE